MTYFPSDTLLKIYFKGKVTGGEGGVYVDQGKPFSFNLSQKSEKR